jgi:outer membrane lipoprotein-sorting protein
MANRNCNKLFLQLAVALYGILSVMNYCSAAETAQDIVQRADTIRFPQQSFQVDVVITSRSDEREVDRHVYQLLSKGKDNTLIRTIEPENEQGRILLMKDYDLWAYMPDISQPIRLSLAQRLTGQVANGDIARTNFSGDYTPKLLRTERVKKENYFVLELIANDRRVTYHRIVYWVNKKNYRPYKAEFYAISGRMLKTFQYLDFNMMEGKVRPTRLLVKDALHSDEQSVLEYSHMRAREFPDKVFTKDYLKKLQ